MLLFSWTEFYNFIRSMHVVVVVALAVILFCVYAIWWKWMTRKPKKQRGKK